MPAPISRRTLLQGALLPLGAAALNTGSMRALAAGKELVVGIVYVGSRDDFGWNQSHARAIDALRSVPGIRVIEEERVPETVAVTKTMQSMIEMDGAGLIFGTSFGYFDPFMVALARKYPAVTFRHPTTLWSADKHPANLGGYFAYIDQAHYAAGVAAGLSSTTGRIGYVAAKPAGLVLRTINSFTLGVRRANPQAGVRLVFTGDWSLPVREAEATNTLADTGCDVIACHVDSPKVVIETAARRKLKTCGHNTSQSALDPAGFVTGAETKYETVYRSFATRLAAGEVLPNVETGGFDKDYVQLTPFGRGATEEARRAALAAVADLKAGKPMYVGPLSDNTGKPLLAAGASFGNYAPEIDARPFLVEGVQGSIV